MIICAFLAATIAVNKGQTWAWFFIGLILGPIGVLFTLCLSDRRVENLEKAAYGKQNEFEVICPGCKTSISVKENQSHVYCPNCGSSITITD